MYVGDSMSLLLTSPKRGGPCQPAQGRKGKRGECRGHSPYWISMEKARQGWGTD